MDIKELSKNDDDTDSDCSFRSDEVLKSKYPVKPRNALKKVHRDFSTLLNRHFIENEDTDALEVEESLLFIREFVKCNPALVDHESNREKHEMACLVVSIRCMIP